MSPQSVLIMARERSYDSYTKENPILQRAFITGFAAGFSEADSAKRSSWIRSKSQGYTCKACGFKSNSANNFCAECGSRME